ncbi:MAG: cob(I)yrinic acid a,c-diamide adenosyltransferase [Bacteroidota bacterium]
MKIYTRTGDRGTTALFGGDRVPKSHPRIEAYGTVDETNSILGVVRASLKGEPGADRLDPVLGEIQHQLFVLGADLATPLGSRAQVPRVESQHVDQLEAWIDRFEEDLEPLKQFILPGGQPAAAHLHVARTACRRAERRTLEAAHDAELTEQVPIYLNRLSDLFFVLARWVNAQAGQPDVTWATTA